jgi:hypothetical protein
MVSATTKVQEEPSCSIILWDPRAQRYVKTLRNRSILEVFAVDVTEDESILLVYGSDLQ